MEDELWWPEGGPIGTCTATATTTRPTSSTADGWRIATMTLTRLQRLFDLAED